MSSLQQRKTRVNVKFNDLVIIREDNTANFSCLLGPLNIPRVFPNKNEDLYLLLFLIPSVHEKGATLSSCY